MHLSFVKEQDVWHYVEEIKPVSEWENMSTGMLVKLEFEVVSLGSVV